MVKVKNILTQRILINLTYALITIIYFIFLGMQYSKLSSNEGTYLINISSLFFLAISILFMEIALRKEKKQIFINGIEFLILATFILLTQHMTRILNYTVQLYMLVGSNFLAMYYLLKSAILYTKEQQERLNSLSDIKEIVKEEPLKKVSKRRNKVTEGK